MKKSMKKSHWAATVHTSPETVGADEYMLSCRADLSIDNVHEKVDTPAWQPVSRSRDAHTKASK